jgi:hypothetical protein
MNDSTVYLVIKIHILEIIHGDWSDAACRLDIPERAESVRFRVGDTSCRKRIFVSYVNLISYAVRSVGGSAS